MESFELGEDICFFCDEPASSVCLHAACTYDIDRKVQNCALELEDTALLSKLAPGDIMALEAKYHQLPIHEVVSGMSPRNCAVLPVIHAFTGCDTISSFSGRGKKSACKFFLMSLKHLNTSF